MQLNDSQKTEGRTRPPDAQMDDPLSSEELMLMESVIADPRVFHDTPQLRHLVALGLVCTDAHTHVSAPSPMAKAWFETHPRPH